MSTPAPPRPPAVRSHPEVWQRRTPLQTLVQWLWLAGGTLLALWSVSALDIEWAFLLDAHEQAADLAGRMWPPRWGYLPTIVAPLLETVHIATLGTLAAVVLAVPVAFLAARNTSANGLTWAIGRGILVASRSINTVIWGLLFVAIFGPGAVAGVFAVAARSVGFIAKLIAEAIEEADKGTIEAVRATGAGNLQTWWVAILPQVMPVLIGTTIYRWDINVRESSVLGFVGAGGIGLYLYASINGFIWQQVLLILVAIGAIVMLSEAVSAWVRGRIS